MPGQEIYISDADQELWVRARGLAEARGISLSALVTEVIRSHVESQDTGVRAATLRAQAAKLRAQAAVLRRYANAAADTYAETGRETAGSSAQTYDDVATRKEARAAELEAQADAIEAAG